MVKTFTNKDLKPVLMEGARGEVREPYYLIEQEGQVVFVVSSGKNGLEFNKTEGYINRYPGIQTYQCLYGYGVLVMQRMDGLEEAKEFKVVTLNPGKVVVVSVGWAMCLVNTGSNFLVVLRNSNLESKYLDTKPIVQKRGFAYYIIEKKGEIGFESNPNYRVRPQITTE